MCEIKQRLKTLKARDAELVESRDRIERERAELAKVIGQTEAELEVAVAAPLPDGEDPKLWLPDEMLIMVLLHVDFVEGLHVCNVVCWRCAKTGV